jgi:hypothetical protein
MRIRKQKTVRIQRAGKENDVKKILFPFIALLLSGAGFLPRQAYAQTRGNLPEMYIPVSGDTLSGIATKECGKTSLWHAVAAINNLASPYRIYAGRAIKLSCEKTQTTIKTVTPLTRASVIPKLAVQEIMPADIVMPIATGELSPTLPFSGVFGSAYLPTVTLAEQTALAAAPKPVTARDATAPPARAKPAQYNGYDVVIGKSDLRGALATQLIIFDNEDEKGRMLPCEHCRINLKPSWAVTAKDGTTVVYTHLKELPAKPFLITIEGINTPVERAQMQQYGGKIPGVHPVLHVMATIGKIGTQGGISFAATGNPFIATAVVAAPRIVKLFMEQREKAGVRKIEAAQAAVDKNNLALYRATTESSALLSSKEAQ